MFSITPSEILVIVVVALIIFGPQRLVEVSRRAGQVAGQFRRTADELRAGLDAEVRSIALPFDEAIRPFREAKSGLTAVGKELIQTAEGELRWVDKPSPAEPATGASDPEAGEADPDSPVPAPEAGKAVEVDSPVPDPEAGKAVEVDSPVPAPEAGKAVEVDTPVPAPEEGASDTGVPDPEAGEATEP